MHLESSTRSFSLRASQRFQSAKKEMLATLLAASEEIRKVKAGASSPEIKEAYTKALQDFSRDRGRELYFPILTSGLGSGPFMEFADGSVKYDMITGIGINFFGHTHPALIEEMIDALPADIMQGNLQPGFEMKELLRTILASVGPDCGLSHGWLMCSGTMANEVALKIIRQKKAPATKILAFRDCFAGRSTAMQEITDNPSYRQGQPLYGEVHYLPFYDPKSGVAASTEATLRAMKEHLTRYPDRFAALMIELIQGEGGFNYAPREYYVQIFEEAKKAGLAIWADEIQTFGRTGELFAFQKFSLHQYVDVVTIGKMLQACMVLFTKEFNPKPGLVSGTFAGSTVAIRTAKRTLDLLNQGGFLGKDGKIEKLSKYFMRKLEGLASGSCNGLVHEIRGIGGMIAFVPFGGKMEQVKSVLMRLFDLGVVAFYCGHGPYLVRLLPPLGAMKETDIDGVVEIIEKALRDVSEKVES